MERFIYVAAVILFFWIVYVQYYQFKPEAEVPGEIIILYFTDT